MALLRTILLTCTVGLALIFNTAQAVEFSFHNPLVDAADAGQEDQVRSLLKARQPVDGRGDFNTTALMRAAYRGHVEIAKMLISSGANLGIRDRGGATALHIASRAGHDAIVTLLIKYGADVNAVDNEGWTPLMRAVISKRPQVTASLVEAGAEILAENEAGDTPITQAATSGSLEVLSALMRSPQFDNVTLSEKQRALEVARKRKHRNIETVFSALIHPPARPRAGEHYARTGDDAPYNPNISGQQARSDDAAMAARAMPPQASQEPRPMGNDRYAVAVPDNGFDERGWAPQTQTQTADMRGSSAAPRHMAQQQQPPSMVKQPSQPVQMQAAPQGKMPVSYGQPHAYAAPATRYLLQLGAFANEDQAFYVWSNLKHRHPDILGQLEPDVMKAFLAYDQSEVYRLRAGGFTDRELAEKRCRTMRERSIECFVIEQSTGGKMMPQPQTPPQQLVQQPQQAPAPAMARHVPVPTQAPANAYASAPTSPSSASAPMQASPYPVYHSGQVAQPAPAMQHGQAPAPYAAVAPAYPYPQQHASAPAAMPSPYAPNYAGAASGAPINPMQVPAPYQQGSAYAGAVPDPAVAEATHAEVREQARKQFFRSQGLEPPQQQAQYGDFYRDVQQLEQQRQRYGGVSEAVRVNRSSSPYSQSQLQQANQMQGIWVHIGDFPNEQYAQDYYQRMFRYDRSFAHLRMVSMKENLPFNQGMAVSMRLGPSGSEAEAYEVCRIAQQGGLNCEVLANNLTAGYQQFETLGLQNGRGITRDTLDPFWLTLGTFEDTGDAEYYWMFLLEDHFDVLGALKYDLERRASNKREPFYLKAGPFLVQQQANRLCDVLKYRNVACVVTH